MTLLSIIYFLNEYFVNLLSVFNTEAMVRNGGLLIICLAVYAQTGLFFCFFVPSGIFLFTGGMFVATGQLQHNLITVCSCSVIACVSGTVTSYWFGRKAGPLLYKRKDSKLFRQKHLKAAEVFYKKYGQLALTIGILFPIIRTFAPVVAGMIRMNFTRFVLLVLIGSLLWILVLVMAGYLMGTIPAIKEYVNYIMIAFILTVTIPVVTRIIREFKKSGKENEGNG